MIKHLLTAVLLLSASTMISQTITATELLDKAIAYHDPDGSWSSLQEKLVIKLSYPDGRERLSEVKIDIPGQYFSLTSQSDDVTIEQTLNKETCTLKLNGSTDISAEDKEKHRISCERAESMKNYYLYLYGLPMKLKDKGTQLSPVVETKTFKGKQYKVLKVTYDETVGKDTWYFYFDPSTYAMEVYQFYHDESKNDGEYILLSGIEEVSNMKIPKVREWYYNKDDKFLGTDTLIRTEPLK